MTTPVFTDEGPEYYGQAFERNRRFAVPSNTNYQTPLSGSQEQAFRMWVERYSVPFDVNAQIVDYDMRGFWLSTGGQAFRGGDFPDTFKTPYDTAFSRESKYATSDNPFTWQGEGMYDPLVDTRSGAVEFQRPRRPGAAPSADPRMGVGGHGRGNLDPAFTPGDPRFPTPHTGIKDKWGDPTGPSYPTEMIPGSHAPRGIRSASYEAPGPNVPSPPPPYVTAPWSEPPGQRQRIPPKWEESPPGLYERPNSPRPSNLPPGNSITWPWPDDVGHELDPYTPGIGGGIGGGISGANPHHAAGFTQGRAMQPQFRQDLLNVIDNHLTGMLLQHFEGQT
jgi:hypothetical protein